MLTSLSFFWHFFTIPKKQYIWEQNILLFENNILWLTLKTLDNLNITFLTVQKILCRNSRKSLIMLFQFCFLLLQISISSFENEGFSCFRSILPPFYSSFLYYTLIWNGNNGVKLNKRKGKCFLKVERCILQI